jgi:hypothetical protein
MANVGLGNVRFQLLRQGQHLEIALVFAPLCFQFISIVPKTPQALFFISILNIEFSKSKLDSHKNLLTICLTSPTSPFLGNKTKTPPHQNDY